MDAPFTDLRMVSISKTTITPRDGYRLETCRHDVKHKKSFLRVAYMDVGKGREQDAEAFICLIYIFSLVF